MEIEILTTKKKLTKQLISQMRFPSLFVLRYGQVLGFLINIKKTDYKIILIEYKGDYFIIGANWQKAELSVYKKLRTMQRSKKFDNLKLCDEWWKAYQFVIEKADMQIYI